MAVPFKADPAQVVQAALCSSRWAFGRVDDEALLFLQVANDRIAFDWGDPMRTKIQREIDF